MNSQELKARIENIPLGDYEHCDEMRKKLISDILNDMLRDESDLSGMSEYNQQLCTISRLRDEIFSLKKENEQLTARVKELEQQIQQAEKRGYELAHIQAPEYVKPYDQAMAERDGGYI